MEMHRVLVNDSFPAEGVKLLLQRHFLRLSTLE